MVSWRPVQGRIERLNPELTSIADIQNFFAEQRILGRGEDDGSGAFRFELAIGGRRRRVATLDEEGQIFLGYSVGDLLQELSSQLRKVEVELDGKIIHGPFDIGAVDVGDADIEFAEVAESELALNIADEAAGSVDAELAANVSADTVEGADSSIALSAEEAAEVAETVEAAESVAENIDKAVLSGPMLAFGDYPLSELSVLSANESREFLAFKSGQINVVISEQALPLAEKLLLHPDFSLELHFSGARFTEPKLQVSRDSGSLTWDWSGQYEPFSWIDGEALNFVEDELGAGAVARRAVADLVDVTFAQVREALLAEPGIGVPAFLRSLSLPKEAIDVLRGERGIAEVVKMIPQARLILPKSTTAAFEEALAWEVMGEGVVESDLARVYRNVYLKYPWAVAGVAAMQAGVGVAIVNAGVRALRSRKAKKGRVPRGHGGKLITTIGGVILANAVSRVLTTRYIQNAVKKLDLPQENSSITGGE